MLFHLAKTKNDEQFKAIYHAIERALWPEKDYVSYVESDKQDGQPDLPAWAHKPPAAERSAEIARSVGDILEHVDRNTRLYTQFPKASELPSTGDQPIGHHHLPFVDRYHRYFAERQWTTPLRNPRDNFEELFRLSRPRHGDEEKIKGDEEANYSKHEWDYNHFLNVVAAAARLIHHFSMPANVESILVCRGRDRGGEPSGGASSFAGMLTLDLQSCTFEGKIDCERMSLAHALSFGSVPDLRTFKLLLAAFYHDLGKTVVYHRHSMEGANILAGHTSVALLQLGDIVRGYDETWSFNRDDLLDVATLLYYHDQFGTLSTGEAGYLRLVDIVDRFKRASTVVGRDDRRGQVKLSMRHLFDLWLLNVADMMVSLKNKGERQGQWLDAKDSEEEIVAFLTSSHAEYLTHDLCIAIDLLEEHNRKWHSDNLAHLEALASEYSSRHVVARIDRLIEASFVQKAGEKCEALAKAKRQDRAMQILMELGKLSPRVRESIILRCIQSVSNFAEFSSRFAWIGQMDYALGFFRQIADRALQRVVEQLSDSGSPTGWINEKALDAANMDRRNHMDAEFLIDNFASTVVQILEHLLFREQDINHLRNIEFEDAGTRLTAEKIDKIIGLEGPYRARRSIESILQTIFVY